MKKIIIAIISAMILMPTMADAQIQKTGSFKAKTLATARMGVVNLKLDGDGIYYLAMKTTNQFDDYMVLKLGENKESAIQSLNDLIDIFDSLNGDAVQYINNGYGIELRLWKFMGGLYISADGYAGDGNVGKGELKRFISAIE